MKVQRKYLQLACLNLFLVMSVILCPHQTYAKGKKFKIYFTNAEKSIKLPLKSSQTLSVRYSKKKKASYKIKWESSNPKVVKVSKKGILTPKKTGKSVIRHVVRTKSGKVIAKKSIKVKVTPEIAIKAISCEEDAASATLIKYPNKYRWNISLKPANASLAPVTIIHDTPDILCDIVSIRIPCNLMSAIEVRIAENHMFCPDIIHRRVKIPSSTIIRAIG